jgi:hypothetical protein
VVIDGELVDPHVGTPGHRHVYQASLVDYSSALDFAHAIAFGPIGRWKPKDGFAVPPLFAHADVAIDPGDRLAAVDLDGDRQADVVWRMVRGDGFGGRPEIERLVFRRGRDGGWARSARLAIAQFAPLFAR